MTYYLKNIFLSFIIILILQNSLLAECVSNFSYIKLNDFTFSFVNTSGYNQNESVYFYWDFGDGNVSQERNPNYRYTTPGLYKVVLTVFTESNCISRHEKEVNVGIEAPSPDCILNIYFETINASAPDFNDGTALVTGSGDYPGYYLPEWSNGQYGAIIENLEPGTYCVTLTRDFCWKSDCVTIGMSEDCEADFDYERIDVYSDTDSYIKFENNSFGEFDSYYWEFGDGNTSTEINPIHNFSSIGEFDVCLTVFAYNGCSETYCQTIEIEDNSIYYANLEGDVYVGNNLLPQGVAILYKILDDDYKAIDYSIIDNGKYYFQNLLIENNYLTSIIPYFDVEEPYFPKYFPTYTFSETYWQNNNLINLENQTQYVTNLHTYHEHYYGEAEINGFVRYQNEEFYEREIFSNNWFNFSGSQQDDNAANMIVFLLNEQKEIINSAITNFDAQFNFRFLDYGSYFLRIEKAGFLSEEIPVILSEEDDNNVFYEFIIQEDIVFLNKNVDKLQNEFSIFPNPFTDKIIINNENHINIKVYDAKSVLVFENFFSSGNAQVNLSFLKSGTYIIQIVSEEKVVNKMLIKM